MRAVLTAVIAAIEGIAVAFAGLLVVAIPAVLLWVVSFGLSADPADVFASAAGIWFLAHFVPLELQVSAEAAVGLGLPQEAIAFVVSLAPLGLTLVTIGLGTRAGWRFGARGGSGAAGALGGAVGFAAVAAAAAVVATPVLAWPAWAAVAVPAAVYGLVFAAAFVVRAARDEHPWWEAVVRGIQRGIRAAHLPGEAAFPARAGSAIRMAVAACAALVLLGAVGIGAAIVAGCVQMMTLSQALQLDALGALVMLIVQLALLPVFVVWAGSWLTGAGFAVGAGSSATPFETLLGPLPALPLFGAIPAGWDTAGAVAPALVVIAGLVVGALFARRPAFRRASWVVVLPVAAAAAVLAGFAWAGLGALASGAIGPERMSETGPSPWLVGALAAAELGGGLLLGVAAGRLDGLRARLGLAGGTADETASEFVDGAGAEADAAADAQATAPLHGVLARLGREDQRERAQSEAERVTRDPSPPAPIPLPVHRAAPAADPASRPERTDETDLLPSDSSDGQDAQETEAFETEELAPLGTPAAEPELFDVEEVEEAEAEAAAAGHGVHENSAEEDELLRAFSWDGAPGADGSAPHEREDDRARGPRGVRPSWPFGRRKR